MQGLLFFVPVWRYPTFPRLQQILGDSWQVRRFKILHCSNSHTIFDEIWRWACEQVMGMTSLKQGFPNYCTILSGLIELEYIFMIGSHEIMDLDFIDSNRSLLHWNFQIQTYYIESFRDCGWAHQSWSLGLVS